MPMPIITLTTDFGSHDACVGTMKGVILSGAPDARIVDICHDVPAHDIVAGAALLEDAYAYFPTGTIHVAIVDPGVGSARAPIAVETERYLFVGPDNGLFGPVLHRESMIEAVKLTNTAFHQRTVSATFHGRDIFSSVAAHLAKGIQIEQLGEHISALQRLDFPMPKPDGASMELRVLRTDRFGNLITNLKREMYVGWNPQNTRIRIKLGDAELAGLSRTYSDVPQGQPVAYFGSGGRLEIAVNCGRAEDHFKVASHSALILIRD